MNYRDKTIETYNPPLVRWRVWNEIEKVELLARVLMDGASIPIGKFRGPKGDVFMQSLDDFHTTERAAVVALIQDYEDGLACQCKQVEELTAKIYEVRIAHAALVRRLATMPETPSV